MADRFDGEAASSKRDGKRGRLLFYFSAVFLVIVLMAAGAWYGYRSALEREQRRSGEGPPAGASGRFNVLVMGTDERAHDPGRTDTMMLVSVDPWSGDVFVLSIPRDTRVKFRGKPGYHKINTAHVYGGPELAMQAVSDLLGIDVHYYVVTDFSGFVKLIDSLGGIELEVEKRMKYVDRAQHLKIDLKPGRQRLNGEQALGYVRFRADGLGDVSLVDPANDLYEGRVERQLKFAKALASEALQPRNLVKLPGLIQEFRQTLDTNLPASALIQLVAALPRLATGRVETAVLPGVGRPVNGVSYWIADDAKVRTMLQAFGGREEDRSITIMVLNGSGVRGVAQRAAELLESRGFRVVYVGNADAFNYERTQVIDGSGGSREALSVARALNTSMVVDGQHDAKTVVALNQEAVSADVTVIVGKDFKI